MQFILIFSINTFIIKKKTCFTVQVHSMLIPWIGMLEREQLFKVIPQLYYINIDDSLLYQFTAFFVSQGWMFSDAPAFQSGLRDYNIVNSRSFASLLRSFSIFLILTIILTLINFLFSHFVVVYSFKENHGYLHIYFYHPFYIHERYVLAINCFWIWPQ